MKSKDLKEYLKREKISLGVLLVCLVLFVVLVFAARSEEEEMERGADYSEYEKAVVTEIVSSTVDYDPASDNMSRGEQLIKVNVLTGQYKGEDLLVYNYAGGLYGGPLKVNDKVAILISTYESGEHTATVYEYDRIPALIGILLLFFAAVALVGGKTGIKSLIGLAFTLICVFMVLIPLLFKGAPVILSTFLISAYIALVSFTILGGIHRKTVSAILGTVAGTAFAMLFGIAAQTATRVNGFRMANVEALLLLRQTGTPIGLRGLLVAGIIISALGAVMDVAMSISSALEEVHQADPSLDSKQLFKSGMNIGRDMVGTMTNTLILAFLGSGLIMTIYLFSLGLRFYQLFPSAYVSIELISGIASSIGMILAIPLTALISSALLTREKA